MADPESASPQELAGPRYALGEQFSRGGMGGIWYARESATGRIIALKRILGRPDPDSFRRFLNEARITARLEHPNIVPVHGLGTDFEDQPFYTMKLVQGSDLAGVLKKLAAGDAETIAAYPLAQLLIIFQKVCDAIAFAHSRRIIHRDLKPANIMLGPYGEVLVMDWGLAKDLDPAKSSSPIGVTGKPINDSTPTREEDVATLVESPRLVDDDRPTIPRPNPVLPAEEVTMPAAVPNLEEGYGQTLPGRAYGSPHYMAPEQARGEVHLHDPRTDIYALGAILYQIVSLRYPVSGKTTAELIARVAEGDLDPLVPSVEAGKEATLPPELQGEKSAGAALLHLPGRVIPESLVAVILRAMAFKPERRYQSVPELQRDITAYQNGFATSAEAAGLGKQILLALRRHRREATIIAAALALLFILAAASFVRIRSERDRATRGEAEARAAQSEAELQRSKAEKINADLVAQRSATERADARSDVQAARRLFESGHPAESVAYLCRALQRDPANLSAFGDLITRMSEVPWLFPGSETVHLPVEIIDVVFAPDSRHFAVALASLEDPEETASWSLYGIDPANPHALSLLHTIPTKRPLRFSQDGKWLVEMEDASRGSEPRARANGHSWNTATGGTVSNGKEKPVLFAPRASCHPQVKGSNVRIVDAKGKALGNPVSSGTPLDSVSCSGDGHFVVAECTGTEVGGGILMWQLSLVEGGLNSLLYTDPDGFINSTRFSPGSHYVSINIQDEGYDGPPLSSFFRLLGDFKTIAGPMEFFDPLRAADFSPDGRFVAAGHAHGQLLLWVSADPAQTGAGQPDRSLVSQFLPEHQASLSLGQSASQCVALKADDLDIMHLPVPSESQKHRGEVFGWAAHGLHHALVQTEKCWLLCDLPGKRNIPLPVPPLALGDPTFTEDDSLVCFHIGGDEAGKVRSALYLVNVATGKCLECPYDEGVKELHFSRHGRFLIVDNGLNNFIYQTADLGLVATYSSAFQNQLWAEEKILDMSPTSELLGAAMALAGRRINADGVMESVPPAEWLRLRAAKSTDADTLAHRFTRWLLQYPDERQPDIFETPPEHPHEPPPEQPQEPHPRPKSHSAPPENNGRAAALRPPPLRPLRLCVSAF